MGYEARLPDHRQTLLRPEQDPGHQPLHRRGRDIESARRKLAASVISRGAPDKDDVLVDDLDTDDELLGAGVTDDAELDDDLLEEDADDNVSLDDLADVAGDEEDV